MPKMVLILVWLHALMQMQSAWANAYKSNTKPEIENDGWIWMKHGDTGVDKIH